MFLLFQMHVCFFCINKILFIILNQEDLFRFLDSSISSKESSSMRNFSARIVHEFVSSFSTTVIDLSAKNSKHFC